MGLFSVFRITEKLILRLERKAFLTLQAYSYLIAILTIGSFLSGIKASYTFIEAKIIFGTLRN